MCYICVQEGGERHSDSSLETESFLRATESVVTAMQARMSLSLDSGGESDVDTSHSYQAPPSSAAGVSTGKHQNVHLIQYFKTPHYSDWEERSQVFLS